MTCSVVHSTDVEPRCHAFQSVFLLIIQTIEIYAYCSRLAMRGRMMPLQQTHQLHMERGSQVHWQVGRCEQIGHRIDSALKAGSLVARERIVRFTDRQSDGRQVIALTEGVIKAGSLMAQLVLTRLIHELWVEQLIFARLLHE